MKPVYIPDVFADVVGKVDDVTYEEYGIHAYYQHGHPLEIIETLQQYGESQTYREKRYPLIALFHDYREMRGTEIGIYAKLPALNIIIATATVNTYKADERYDKNFKPVLYPIYYELLHQIAVNKSFDESDENRIEHDKWDRLYWGRQGLYGNTGNIFNDYIDAIEIDNLNLKLNLKNC